jgi:hypothetical protein
VGEPAEKIDPSAHKGHTPNVSHQIADCVVWMDREKNLELDLKNLAANGQ